MSHTFVHTDVGNMMTSFRYDAHPMGMLVSTLAAVSTLHPEANPALAGDKVYSDKKMRNKQVHRLIGSIPTLAANAYRHRIGREFNKPQKDLSYIEVLTTFQYYIFEAVIYSEKYKNQAHDFYYFSPKCQ